MVSEESEKFWCTFWIWCYNVMMTSFVTYKRLAKTDKKGVIWICVPIWQSRIIFLAACVQVIMMLFKYETFTMRQNFVFLFIYLFYLIQLSSDFYALKLSNMNTITRCQIYSKLKVQPYKLKNCWLMIALRVWSDFCKFCILTIPKFVVLPGENRILLNCKVNLLFNIFYSLFYL